MKIHVSTSFDGKDLCGKKNIRGVNISHPYGRHKYAITCGNCRRILRNVLRLCGKKK